MYKLLIVAATALLAVGCRSVDVASQTAQLSSKPRKCEVHGREMQPEWIRVSAGEMAYVVNTRYPEALKHQFPHHGGWLLSCERNFHYAFTGRVRDFVCPDCTEAFEHFWKRGPVAGR